MPWFPWLHQLCLHIPDYCSASLNGEGIALSLKPAIHYVVLPYNKVHALVSMVKSAEDDI
jgi:hypothetical protein